MRVRDALIGVLAVGLVAGGSGLAATSPAPTAASNLAAAQAEAERLLTLVPLPPGAVGSTIEPVGDGAALRYPTIDEATPNLVDAQSWWTTQASPAAVLDYVATHVPAGATQYSETVGFSGSPPWFRSYAFPPVPGVLDQRLIGVEVTPLPGGETGIRTDGEAIWISPRPSWEQIPAGVKTVEITARGGSFSGRPGPRSSPIILTGTRAARLVEFVNAAEIVQPGFRSCPAEFPESVSLGFISAGGQTLAHATENPTGCAAISLTVGGRTGPDLSDYPSLTDELLQLDALLTCPVDRLTRSGPPSQASPASPITFTLENRSDLMCWLPAFPKLVLYSAAGHRIATTVTDAGAGWVRREGVEADTILDPHQSASFHLSYRSCRKAPVATRARITLGGTTGRLLIPLGSRRRPVAPCNGRLTVSSFSWFP